MTPTLAVIRKDVAALADPARAVGVARFFKTGKGEYGEGDRFLGIYVPQLRVVARRARGLSLDDRLTLLRSKWHEERLLALMLLVDAHERGTDSERRKIHRAYLANLAHVNNWDLVDSSAAELVGSHVPADGTRLIERLAKSKTLWERRVAMIATHHEIRAGRFDAALMIAERLLDDEHDLMHKAVGWMLREVGKRSPETLREFLERHAATMPRTALRYAIERFTPSERKQWMARRASTNRIGARTKRVPTARSATLSTTR